MAKQSFARKVRMSYRVISEGRILRLVEQMGQRARNLLPATGVIGEHLARVARARAPVGKGRGHGALRHGLNHDEPAHNVTVLQSPQVYAGVQQYGGPVAAGKGPLGAQMLAIPVNEAAKRLYETLGAGKSLKDVPGLGLVVLNGKLFLMGTPGLEARRALVAERKGQGKRMKRARVRDFFVLFVLKRSVQLNPNPAPAGYAPKLGEPEIVEYSKRVLRRYLSTGVA